MGYTVNFHPHPFTDPSLVNFQRISWPLTRNSCDQSLQSRPERTDTVRPEASTIVSGSWRRSVEHWWSNSMRRPSAPGRETRFYVINFTCNMIIQLSKRQEYMLYVEYTSCYTAFNNDPHSYIKKINYSTEILTYIKTHTYTIFVLQCAFI